MEIPIKWKTEEIFLEISQNMRNEFPQKQKTSTVLPQHVLLYPISVNASGNTFQNGTQNYVCFFAYAITNQLASKKYYNIAVGRTALKEKENSI